VAALDKGGPSNGTDCRVRKILTYLICYRNAPYVGMLTIWLNDYPMLKWAVIGTMFLTVLVSKDPS
jgi:signal peptidase